MFIFNTTVTLPLTSIGFAVTAIHKNDIINIKNVVHIFVGVLKCVRIFSRGLDLKGCFNVSEMITAVMPYMYLLGADY